MAKKSTPEQTAVRQAIDAFFTSDGNRDRSHGIIDVYRAARADLSCNTKDGFTSFVRKQIKFPTEVTANWNKKVGRDGTMTLAEYCDDMIWKAFFAGGEQNPGVIEQLKLFMERLPKTEKDENNILEFASRPWEKLPAAYQQKMTQEGQRVAKSGTAYWGSVAASLKKQVAEQRQERQGVLALATAAAITASSAWAPETGRKPKSILDKILRTPNTSATGSIQDVLAAIAGEA